MIWETREVSECGDKGDARFACVMDASDECREIMEDLPRKKERLSIRQASRSHSNTPNNASTRHGANALENIHTRIPNSLARFDKRTRKREFAPLRAQGRDGGVRRSGGYT